MDTQQEFDGLISARDRVDGIVYMKGLYERTFRDGGDDFYEGWPLGYSRLFRLYKRASRDFQRSLYRAAADITPWQDLHELARPVLLRREDEDWELQLPKHFPHHPYIILVDIVALRSSKDRIRPEMVLASQAEVSARRLTDAWWKEERAMLPFDAKLEEKGRRHKRWTTMLAERLEILRPEYEKWHSNATASLQAVCEATVQISLDE